MAQSWNRFKQATRETLSNNSKDQKTDIPSDINGLLLKAESTSTLLKDCIQKAATHFNGGTYHHQYESSQVSGSSAQSAGKVRVKHADDLSRSQTLYILAEAMDNLSSSYPHDEFTKQYFGSVNKVLCLMARKQAELNDKAYECFIQPKQLMLKENIQGADDHYEKLKQRRLDLDAKKFKLKQEVKSANGDAKIKKYETEVQLAQGKFDSSANAIRELLVPLSNDADTSAMRRVETAQTLKAMLNFYRECAELMEQLDQGLDLDGIIAGHQTAPQSNNYNVDKLTQSMNSSVINQSTPQSPMSTQSHGRSHMTQHAFTYLPAQNTASASSSRPHSPSVNPHPSAPPLDHARLSQQNIPPVLKPKPHLPVPPVLKKNFKMFKAVFNFDAEQDGDLNFVVGDVIRVSVDNGTPLDPSAAAWWKGTNLSSGLSGNFPSNFVKEI
ncbi:hypothetical protein MP228_012916 [Amoeboaphelidium protococcarum]|nr:hypothetical protein MP228_012916 [Amoeboaphelidium protococcarum]